MRLLLDTHIFVWYILADPRLSERMRAAIHDPQNRIYVSAVSLWEASIKYSLGKWPLPQPPETLFPAERIKHGMVSLPVEEPDVIEAAKLPPLHKDPFDRLMLGQALRYGLTLVTVDAAIRAYPMAPVF